MEIPKLWKIVENYLSAYVFRNKNEIQRKLYSSLYHCINFFTVNNTKNGRKTMCDVRIGDVTNFIFVAYLINNKSVNLKNLIQLS